MSTWSLLPEMFFPSLLEEAIQKSNRRSLSVKDHHNYERSFLSVGSLVHLLFCCPLCNFWTWMCFLPLVDISATLRLRLAVEVSICFFFSSVNDTEDSFVKNHLCLWLSFREEKNLLWSSSAATRRRGFFFPCDLDHDHRANRSGRHFWPIRRDNSCFPRRIVWREFFDESFLTRVFWRGHFLKSHTLIVSSPPMAFWRICILNIYTYIILYIWRVQRQNDLSAKRRNQSCGKVGKPCYLSTR